MLELILTTLAEFGLIRKDYLHKKRIAKKEKEDGIKRPFQKYFMQPSVKTLVFLLVVTCLSALLFFRYQKTSVYPKETKEEMAKMSNRMNQWYEKFGEYPADLNELIGNSPIRQDWKKDAWNQPYKLTVSENKQSYLIISAGLDRQFETEDDIIIELKKKKKKVISHKVCKV